MNVIDEKILESLKKIIDRINKELARNRRDSYTFSIEQILIHRRPDELYEILYDKSPTFRAVMEYDKYGDTALLLNYYIESIYSYYDSILFREQAHFDNYVSFSRNERSGEKSYTSTDLEMDLSNISNTIDLLNEAIRLWFDVYNKRLIVAEFSSGKILRYKIKEGELAHLFGLIWNSLKNNEQLKKMGIVIPDTELEPEQKYDILLKITELYKDGNILEYERDRLKKLMNPDHVYTVAEIDHRFDFLREKQSLLPYPKLNVRTKAFIDFKPIERLSLLLDFKQGLKILKTDKNKDDVKNALLLSENDYSSTFNWTGILSTQDPVTKKEYMRSLIVNNPSEYKEYIDLLNQLDEKGEYSVDDSITTKVSIVDEEGGGGGEEHIFSEEEQRRFILHAMAQFNNCSFRNIIDYLNEISRGGPSR